MAAIPGVRRSETFEQHEYERDIHENQNTASSDDTNGDLDKDHAPEPEGKRKGLLRRFKNQMKSSFPEAIQDLKLMGSLTALETRVKKDITDATLFPEVNKVAEVRRGLDLCPEEQAFLEKRKALTHLAFAKYLELDPKDVHPDDVPTISFGGSGGGFRAMIGCLAYCDEMHRAGLWDCLTYVAGVSGSCWSLAAFYTFGKANFGNVIEHCKKRFSPYHPLSGDAIRTLLSTPGGANSTLGPVIQKSKSGLQTVAMDLYSVFTTGWIFFQEDPADHPGGSAKKELAGYQRSWHRFSSAREYTDTGSQPLPIMTAIRHERPWKDWHDKEVPFADADASSGDHAAADNAWFQWFEIGPYEIGCDEIEAWVPTWGFGRPFEEGKSTMQLPEQSLALLLGLCTSAPAGPLTSYLATISRNLPSGFLGNSIHSLAHTVTRFWGKKGTAEFENHHPLHACNEHNFMYHYTPLAAGETARPPGLENSPKIHLIDSGMDNNCPTYVLLHTNRRADVVINMDASSDVQKDTFAERVEQIGGRRGLKFERIEPPATSKAAPKAGTAAGADSENPNANEKQVGGEKGEESREKGKDQDRTTKFLGLYAQIYTSHPCPRPATVEDSYGKTVPTPPAPLFNPPPTHLSQGTESVPNGPATTDPTLNGSTTSDSSTVKPCTMIYMPLLPNEAAVPDFDPSTAKFSGSYNLVWTAEQVETLVKVCRANFREGEGRVKRVLREAWERRREERLAREMGKGAQAGNGTAEWKGEVVV